MYYILIESAGNQSFIFATNRLKEIVGASQAIVRLAKIVRKAAGKHGVEVVYATSGKALLHCADEEAAKSVIGAVTEEALTTLPGIDVRGVFVEESATDDASLHTAIRLAHRRMDEARCLWPGPEARFVQLPPVSLCASSPWPAAEWDISGKREGASSASAIMRRGLVEKAQARLDRELGRYVPLPNNIGELDDLLDGDWLAVVHADVNGLGALFERFDQIATKLRGVEPNPNSGYLQRLKEVSEAFVAWTGHAFRAALAATAKRMGFGEAAANSKVKVPVVPLVLGGDDLTVACSGSWGLTLAKEYVRYFSALTVVEGVDEDAGKAAGDAADLLHLVAEADGRSPAVFSVAAGVALVKPHYPLHAAFEMAERLTRNAKAAGRVVLSEDVTKPGAVIKPGDVTTPCSAVDFHVQYDATGTDLESVRRTWDRSSDKGIAYRLSARPYLVRSDDDETCLSERNWDRLEKAAEACRAPEDAAITSEGRERRLSRVLLHSLRDDLFRDDPETADRHLRRVGERYDFASSSELLGKDGAGWTLFQKTEDLDPDGTRESLRVTRLLDGLDAAPFLPASQNPAGRAS